MAKVLVKVIGERAVAGVYAPNTVELDDRTVRIRPLLKAGYVELVDAPQPPPAPQAATVTDVPPEVQQDLRSAVRLKKGGGDVG